MDIFLSLAPRSARQLFAKTERALRAANQELSTIGKSSASDPLGSLNRIAVIIVEVRNQVSFFAAVHPDIKIRKTAEESVRKLAKFFPELYMRRDVYEAVRAVSPANLDHDAKRFREKELLDFKLTGVDKPAATRKEIRRLIDQGVQLGQVFDRNIKDDVRHVVFSTDELDGLPEDYRRAHKPDRRGMVRLSTDYPDYFPFMKYAKSGDARRRFQLVFSNRGWPKNEKVFAQLLAVRRKQAKLLGFRSWADYVTVDKMTGSAKVVDGFLNQVNRFSQQRARKDYAMLLARKRRDEPGARAVTSWEAGYYENLVIKDSIHLDSEEIRNYFQFARVKAGVLKKTAQLFGLSYRRARVPTWHKDVEAYDAYRGKKLIGRFYLDLHPRPGKYGHAACFDIRPGISGKQLPEAALVCNFSRELMDHGEVTTFFHEFGHLIHFILGGDQAWARFSGFATEWDFVESPSQMLEAWAFDFSTLQDFARHQKTKKPISRGLVAKMREADSFGRGMWQKTQIFYAMLSLHYHGEKEVRAADLLPLLKSEQKKYSMFGHVPGTHFYANFGHLNGYSALYYTYSWSRAIAEDLFSQFKKHGMYDRKTAKRYVDDVLAPGGSEDASELVRNFLGRNWKLDAFKKWLEEE